MIADLIALDRDGQPVLLVAVRARVLSPRSIEAIVARLKTAGTGLAFGMVADFEAIRVFDLTAETPTPLLVLKTDDVLRHYDPEFLCPSSASGARPVFHDYFETLVQAWLRDLAYHWKSEAPPGSEALASIGLLQRLEGGATQSEVPLGVDALH
ncbi:MAG: hypothetical protein IRY99_10830 [Isosphaeraceae bacterium]|nr:hypothetical protein [Isosphaeraceae bacterium]